MRQASQVKRKIWSVTVDDTDSHTSQAIAKTDYLAIEEPLEIRLKANEDIESDPEYTGGDIFLAFKYVNLPF